MGAISRENVLILSGLNSEPDRLNQYRTLSDFHVSVVQDLEGVYSAIQRGSADCVLIDGVAADLKVEILEAIHDANPALPVVFCSPEMTAGLAVRLTRAGAHHCFDTSESIDELCHTLKSAAAGKLSHERVLRGKRGDGEVSDLFSDSV